MPVTVSERQSYLFATLCLSACMSFNAGNLLVKLPGSVDGQAFVVENCTGTYHLTRVAEEAPSSVCDTLVKNTIACRVRDRYL